VKSAISGPPELVDFVLWCEEKHGHLVNTWRRLDSDGNMTLSKGEFVKGLTQMGYDREDTQKVWRALHRHTDDEHLSFIHFVPDLAIDLGRFKHWCEETFQGVRAAFRAFDHDGNGRLSYKEFLHACERYGMWQRLKEIVHTLFVMLDDGSHRSGLGEITETELDFLERWRCPAYLWAEPDFVAKREFWKQLLSCNKDNPLIAWRKALDKDGNMKVEHSEFYKAIIKFIRSSVKGNHSSSSSVLAIVNRVYITFDPHRSGYISLRRWDSHVYKLLVNFTHWARGEFGKVSASVQALEYETGQGISLGAFRTGTKSLGMSEEDLRVLFSGLSLEGIAKKAGKISVEELYFLDKWDPDKMLEDELAWERMIGSRFTSPQAVQGKKALVAAARTVKLGSRLRSDSGHEVVQDGGVVTPRLPLVSAAQSNPS
jgi:Ca2+-binding EF-hand superfamily protein